MRHGVAAATQAFASFTRGGSVSGGLTSRTTAVRMTSVVNVKPSDRASNCATTGISPVYRLLFQGTDPKDEVGALMGRKLRAEHEHHE